MRNLLILSFFLLSKQVSFGQVQSDTLDESIPWKYGINNTVIGVHIMPFSLAVKYPRLRAGILAAADRWQFALDVEYGNRYIRDIRKNQQNLPYHFLGFRPEVRYSFDHGFPEVPDRYVSIEVPFNWINSVLPAGEYDDEKGNEYLFDRARLKRFRYAVLLKTGVAASLGERFYVDAYIGIGAGQREVRYSDQVNLRQRDYDPIEEWGLGFNSNPREGIIGIADFALGFRIGYIIIE